jgi:hypothetical protein
VTACSGTSFSHAATFVARSVGDHLVPPGACSRGSDAEDGQCLVDVVQFQYLPQRGSRVGWRGRRAGIDLVVHSTPTTAGWVL